MPLRGTPMVQRSGDIAAALRGHVTVLAGEIGERNIFRPAAYRAAAAYIEDTWARQGYLVGRQTYRAKGVESANLEVVRPGRSRPDEVVVIGAHYDSVKGSPGANDNGSGVAALLELARLLREVETTRTVRLVAFANEEAPFFFWGEMGSMLYARRARARGEDIRLMVSLETMGFFSDAPGSQRYPPFFRFFYPDRGNFIAFVSDLRSRRVLRRAGGAFRACSDFPVQHAATFRFVPGVGWSDHLSFWRQGYRALMVTDTAPYRYPHYHTAEDTPDKVDYGALGRLTAALGGAFRSLADSPRL